MKQGANVVALAAVLATMTVIAGAADLPNLDLSLRALPEQPAAVANTSKDLRDNALRDLRLKRGQGSAASAYNSHFDRGLGADSFLWAQRKDRRGARYLPLKSGDQRLERAARDFLGHNASALGLSKQAIAQAQLFDRDLRPGGPAIARFRQLHRGLPVFGRSLGVMMDRSGEPVAVSGYFAPIEEGGESAERRAQAFGLRPKAAVAIAFKDLRRAAVRARAPSAEPYALRRPARTKPVYFPLGRNPVPAHYLEIEAGPAERGGTDSYAYVISAADGRILFRKNLRAYDAYSYRVFADGDGINAPWESPLGTELNPVPNSGDPSFVHPRVPAVPNLVTLEQGPIGTSDPWLPPAATATVGNNADVYLDLAEPDGFTPATRDARAVTNAPSMFDYLHQAAELPSAAAQRSAGVSSLFYTLNFLHDWWYGNGFNEAAGNAQFDNFGRGGIPGDPILAEAQDFSGINNANMTTPADGGSPRLQMYLFPGASQFTVNAPAPLAGDKAASTAAFGLQVFDFTAELAGLLDAANEAGPGTTDACSAALNPGQLAGRVALISDGGCSYKTKARNAQNAGASGVVIAGPSGSTLPPGQDQMGDDVSVGAVSVPVLGIAFADAEALRIALASSTVRVRMLRRGLDSAMDNSLVAHEWFHYVSNRLIGDAGGLTNPQGLALGEGWSDFSALLLTVRDDDRFAPGNESFGGAYSVGGYLSSSLYFGIRRAPYSTDFNLYPLSFRHIADQNVYDGPVPFRPKTRNSQIHNAGEIWANTLWEIYAALLNDPRYSFDQARERMKDYVIAGLRMTPGAPTFTEARDALLAAALATDRADFELMGRAFAKRGMGMFARSPDRSSTDHAGVVESFVLAPAFEVSDVSLDMSASETGPGPCDADGVLDVGETGLLRLKIRNRGTAALSGAFATVASPGAVHFGDEGVLNFPDAAPGAEVEATVAVTLDQAVSGQAIDFTFHFPQLGDSPDAVVEPGDHVFTTQVDFDRTANVRAMDDLSQPAASLADWSVSASGDFAGWQIVDVPTALGTGKAWLGPDNDVAGAIQLATPALSVDPAKALVMEFDQAYDFEPGYDGGRIEISSDGGASWTEVTLAGGVLSVPYSGVAATFPAGAYTGTRSTLQHVRLAFAPGALSGDAVRLRFHIGTDNSVGAGGWLIDNVQLSGLAQDAFSSVGPDLHACTPRIAEFVAKASRAGEGAGNATVELRLSEPALEVVRIPVSVGGSAGTGDYEIPGGSEIVIPPGENRGGIDVTIDDDAADESEETVIFTMGEPVGALSGSVLTHTLTIEDDDAPPVASFGAATRIALEHAGRQRIALRLSAASAFDVSLPFTVQAGSTAESGDYAVVTASPVVIPAGETTAGIDVDVIEDTAVEPDEDLVVQLGTPVNATLGAPQVHTLTIEDDDGAPRVAFAETESVYDEGAGTVLVTVTLSRATTETVTVPFSVSGSADEADRSLVSRSPLEIPAGASAVSIALKLIDDAVNEADQTVVLSLGVPDNAERGTRSTHTLSIRDNDTAPPGSVRFSASTYSVSESGGSVFLKVGRSDISSAASVVVSTSDGTAEAGRDYAALSQTLSWAAGEEGGKTVRINLVNDAAVEGTETIRVKLSSPAGLVLGAPSVAAVRILDNDTAPAADRTPEAFAFKDLKGVAMDSVQTSNAITVRGINVPVALSVSGGSYSVNGGPFTSRSGQVRVGDSVRLRHISADEPAAAVRTRLVIGGVDGSFTSTTVAADTRPDAFHFIDQRGVKARRDVLSNTVTIRGLSPGVTVPVTLSKGPGGDASYSINDRAFDDGAGRVRNGDRLRLRNRILEPGGSARAMLTVGGVSDSWIISTGK